MSSFVIKIGPALFSRGGGGSAGQLEGINIYKVYHENEHWAKVEVERCKVLL